MNCRPACCATNTCPPQTNCDPSAYNCQAVGDPVSLGGNGPNKTETVQDKIDDGRAHELNTAGIECQSDAGKFPQGPEDETDPYWTREQDPRNERLNELNAQASEATNPKSVAKVHGRDIMGRVLKPELTGRFSRCTMPASPSLPERPGKTDFGNLPERTGIDATKTSRAWHAEQEHLRRDAGIPPEAPREVRAEPRLAPHIREAVAANPDPANRDVAENAPQPSSWEKNYAEKGAEAIKSPTDSMATQRDRFVENMCKANMVVAMAAGAWATGQTGAAIGAKVCALIAAPAIPACSMAGAGAGASIGVLAAAAAAFQTEACSEHFGLDQEDGIPKRNKRDGE